MDVEVEIVSWEAIEDYALCMTFLNMMDAWSLEFLCRNGGFLPTQVVLN